MNGNKIEKLKFTKVKILRIFEICFYGTFLEICFNGTFYLSCPVGLNSQFSNGQKHDKYLTDRAPQFCQFLIIVINLSVEIWLLWLWQKKLFMCTHFVRISKQAWVQHHKQHLLVSLQCLFSPQLYYRYVCVSVSVTLDKPLVQSYSVCSSS